MAYSGLRMLMDDLKKIIHGNHHPLINNHPMILSERPQLQLLYQELDSVIQTLSNIHQHHRHHHLKKRLKDAAEEAQYRIDLFLYDIHHSYTPGLSSRSDVSETSLDLENVMRSIESIKVEFMTINMDNMKLDSSPRIDTLKTHFASDAAGTSTSSTRIPLRKMKPSTEEIVAGLDRDIEIIRDKLAEDSKQLGVVSVVGMGGLGKTTLATKVFNDRFVVYHFHVRAWVTVSQTYTKRDLLDQVLTSMGVQKDLEEDNDYKLREKLHKNLMGRRYLIVIDDIWSIEAWDELKLFFPQENTRSRILLTTRLNEVALHVKPHGFVHSLPCLTEKESWELLKQKVFHGDECPGWLIKSGMQIAKKCHGLPLSVVVMAGVLAQEPMNKYLWENIACSVSSYIVGDENGCLETLALSYHHLPDHLRECFLYLGGFPEDFMMPVKRLIWLWVAEGFIEEAENRSLEDTAKAYLMDLINRNLVIVARRNEVGEVKAFKLHDLVRELCMQKAIEEGFFLKIGFRTSSSQFLEGSTYEQRRVFTNQNVNFLNIPHSLIRTIRTLISFHVSLHLLKSFPHSFVLLRVLDLRESGFRDFPQGLALLVHLRYLAIQYLGEFPNSICNLRSLQTLILIRAGSKHIYLPSNISDLVNLRHLWSNSFFCLLLIEKPMNLHSISKVMGKYGIRNVQKCCPNIKKLVLYDGSDFQICSNNFFAYLENLRLLRTDLRGHIVFPAILKKLSLIGCELPWSHMSIIQLLPNLEVLKLERNVFTTGRQWDASEQQFRQLKFLMLKDFDIKQWEASSASFPCLKHLSVSWCKDLEEIPLEIGEIATLELIEIDTCNKSVVESVKRIKQEQDNEGNDELKIIVNGWELSFYLSLYESSESE